MQRQPNARDPSNALGISDCTSFNRGMRLEAIAALLGHYAGDPVKEESRRRHQEAA